MPIEWLHLLGMKGVDKAELIYNLNNKYTVADVYDMLEVASVEALYTHLEIQEQKNNANR